VAKKKAKKSDGSGLIVVIVLGAVIVVLALIVLGGGFAPPAAQVTAESLALCNGAPCPSKGSPDAPVVVVEFSDYACHNCRDFNLTTAPALDREYVGTGKVRYVSHVFSLWPESIPAAAASLCAHEQGKYWEFHEQAFVNFQQGRFPASEEFMSWARQAEFDEAAFQQCVESGRYVDDAQLSALEGKRAGVSSTPTFFVNGAVVQGNAPLELRSAIDAALAGR